MSELQEKFISIMNVKPAPAASSSAPVQNSVPFQNFTGKRNPVWTASLFVLVGVVVVLLYHKRCNGLHAQFRKHVTTLTKPSPPAEDTQMQLEDADYDQTDPLFQPFEY